MPDDLSTRVTSVSGGKGALLLVLPLQGGSNGELPSCPFCGDQMVLIAPGVVQCPSGRVEQQELRAALNAWAAG